jgi:hypothetical protein
MTGRLKHLLVAGYNGIKKNIIYHFRTNVLVVSKLFMYIRNSILQKDNPVHTKTLNEFAELHTFYIDCHCRYLLKWYVQTKGFEKCKNLD